MQLILFVELCSEMSSRMIFWPNKSICTLIWIPSKYTQMSVNPNHYLEPCPIRKRETIRKLEYSRMNTHQCPDEPIPAISAKQSKRRSRIEYCDQQPGLQNKH